MIVRLDNIVASVYFFKSIDIKELSKKIETSVYDKKKFPALVIRYINPTVTVLLFSTGKAVITGAKTIEQIQAVVNDLLQKLGDDFRDVTPAIDIVNMVYSVKTDNEFNLDEIALSIMNCEYDPEQFTGLVYRPRHLRSVLLVFSSGSMVCAGAKNEQEVFETLLDFYKELEKWQLIEKIPSELTGGDENVSQ